eukprot:973562-Amphidinium_carterae.3
MAWVWSARSKSASLACEAPGKHAMSKVGVCSQSSCPAKSAPMWMPENGETGKVKNSPIRKACVWSPVQAPDVWSPVITLCLPMVADLGCVPSHDKKGWTGP